MPKLAWDAVSEHLFETGVDHGVLFPMDALGDYEKQLKKGMNPVFKSTDIGMKEKLDCWK